MPLLKPLPYPLIRKLSTQLYLPFDMRNCINHITAWQEIFGRSRGLILLVIGIKFPVARKSFVEGYRAASTTSEVHRVYLACVAMVLSFGDVEKHKQLAEDIDAIKGPLYAHGILIYMRRIGIVVTSRNSEGIRLGLGSTLVKVVPYNASIGTKIKAFLRMSPVLLDLPIASNLSSYGVNKLIVSRAMKRFSVPQCTTIGYNEEWTFRTYQLAECRANGVQRLGFGASDTVSMLPGPDVKNVRRELNPKRTLDDLYTKQGITTFPE